MLDRQPLLHSKAEDDKGFDGENGSVVFYDEIPLILEHPKWKKYPLYFVILFIIENNYIINIKNIDKLQPPLLFLLYIKAACDQIWVCEDIV